MQLWKAKVYNILQISECIVTRFILIKTLVISVAFDALNYKNGIPTTNLNLPDFPEFAIFS